MKKDSVWTTIRSVVYPYLIYLIVSVLVQVVIFIPLCIQTILKSQNLEYAQIYETVMNELYKNTMLLTFVSSVVTIPILYYIYLKDKKTIIKNGMLVKTVPLPIYTYGYALIFGAAVCLWLNQLIDLSGIIRFSPVYQEVEDKIYKNHEIMTFLTSVLTAPVIEEILFRGLIYKRLQNSCSILVAALISSAVFGVTHGNLVQFVYALCAGLFLSYVYEKYKNIVAPILFHGAANFFAMTGIDQLYVNQSNLTKVILLLIETIAVFLVYRLIDLRINRIKDSKNLNEETIELSDRSL